MLIIPIIFLGLFVALVSIFLGLGGGVLLVPLLPTFFKISIHEAVATSLTTIFLVVSVNTYRFHRQKLVNWSLVALMGPISALTAFFAAKYSQQVDKKIILLTLVSILVLVALKTFIFSMLTKNYKLSGEVSLRQKLFAFIGGGVAGAVSGFAGVGSGAIIGPVMVFLKIVEPIKLSPTSNANMVFATFSGTISFLLNGSFVSWRQWGVIRWDLAGGLFSTAILFSFLLSPYQQRLPFRVKTLLLSVLLISLITKILYQLSL